MSKSKRHDHRNVKVSQGRNLDLQAMFSNPKGGPHQDKRTKRANNPNKREWDNDESDC